MKLVYRTVSTLGLIVLTAILITLLAAAFVRGFMWAAAFTGTQHAIGGDVQTTKAYATVSGYLPMIVTALGFAGVFVTAFKHFNCHVNSPRFCWRFGHPVVTDSGGATTFRACHKHNEHREDDGTVTAGHIRAAQSERSDSQERNA